jgi:hypothetical protein
MNKKTTKFVLTLIALLVTLPALTACEDWRDGREGGHRHRGEHQQDGGEHRDRQGY